MFGWFVLSPRVFRKFEAGVDDSRLWMLVFRRLISMFSRAGFG